MTSTASSGRIGRGAPDALRASGINRSLAALEAAAAGGASLGLDTAPAEAVLAEARERLGIAADAYVLALVGGTGVGKSSLLNALAGTEVSPAGVRRPTTGTPVAWVARTVAGEIGPLLDRLGVVDRRLHDEAPLEAVVILDLPDIDSLDAGHREAVEAVLPKLDAVAWVTDPEKYADAILHDGFLGRWVPRLERQVVVLTKADLLPPRALESVRADLGRLLAAQAARSHPGPPGIIAVSSVTGPAGVAPVLAWLEAAVEAKAVVSGRLVAACGAAVEELARLAGVHDRPYLPLITPEARGRATSAAIAELLGLVDLAGAQRQAVAATRAQARPRGGGPLGRLSAFAYRASGRQRRVADPAAYLRGWRGRGSVSRAAAPIREAIAGALPAAPVALRGSLAATSQAGQLEDRLGDAVDGAVAAHGELGAPTSRIWAVIGVLQTANLALLVFAGAWLLLWIIGRPPVDVVRVPPVGDLPVPFALLVLGLLIGFLLARALAVHAGWIGRRWASRIAEGIRSGVEEALHGEAFAAVDALDAGRRQLWLADRTGGTPRA